MEEPEALIFNIQRCSIHDGPGIRTVVFFKGCSLRCRWCSNPESIRPSKEIAWKMSSCIGCGTCITVCSKECLRFEDKGILIDRKRCDMCGACVNACPAKAYSIFGRWYTVDALFEEIMLDTSFFIRSGGGVTLSGGEPLMRPEFAASLLRRIRKEHFSTCIETSGNYKFTEAVDEVFQATDHVLFDIKHVDTARYTAYTGGDPSRIMKNLRTLAQRHPYLPITVRTPVIPGFNDNALDIQAITQFVASIRTVRDHELLPYHTLGESKYANLGCPYPMADVARPTKQHMEELTRIVRTFAVTKLN